MPRRPNLYKKLDGEREVKERASLRGPESYRSQYRRDYARIIHCAGFRRLQGKTQLFPSHESDFFRNRLTHSLEVAQIAKSIAIRINNTHEYFKRQNIDTDVVELAGLSHDLGHPPFGHNGEATLDSLMLNHGGFEGNAQTLRLLSRLEKKTTTSFPSEATIAIALNPDTHEDLRKGLNLSYRSLAAILKYDRKIPVTTGERNYQRSEKKPVKGYYASESDLVEIIKSHVAPGNHGGETFKTVECSIMDVADDIAYSTYDLEDAFKGKFLSPIEMMSKSDNFKKRIAEKVQTGLNEKYKNCSQEVLKFTEYDVNEILSRIFLTILSPDEESLQRLVGGVEAEEAAYILSASVADRSASICEQGYLRTEFTSYLVGEFIRDIEVELNERCPALTKVKLNVETFKKVETLKHFTYELIISSPMLKLAEQRGDQIIRKLFESFMDQSELLPNDWKILFGQVDNNDWNSRVVCDYIAGMTDRYCVEMYARLTSENPISIWKPH